MQLLNLAFDRHQFAQDVLALVLCDPAGLDRTLKLFEGGLDTFQEQPPPGFVVCQLVPVVVAEGGPRIRDQPHPFGQAFANQNLLHDGQRAGHRADPDVLRRPQAGGGNSPRRPFPPECRKKDFVLDCCVPPGCADSRSGFAYRMDEL